MNPVRRLAIEETKSVPKSDSTQKSNPAALTEASAKSTRIKLPFSLFFKTTEETETIALTQRAKEAESTDKRLTTPLGIWSL